VQVKAKASKVHQPAQEPVNNIAFDSGNAGNL
jgi:hypothetical protein